ncbi:hypothetical protein BDY17DRAFT_173189 [Neohortaea acidophila]|uniref:Uncharacterized protein n=1 Tax=Neohortaea acidophila TaxID=245834 RepID=A0A6A6PPE2_9PEZI|nr:uncharacterized protein BDY17DRAFT_173189 [Neohortaea acidophila]KAF2481882.1 hypothetical protein BDY17DRAFT_173189 [Neohortaea acidophila]
MSDGGEKADVSDTKSPRPSVHVSSKILQKLSAHLRTFMQPRSLNGVSGAVLFPSRPVKSRSRTVFRALKPDEVQHASSHLGRQRWTSGKWVAAVTTPGLHHAAWLECNECGDAAVSIVRRSACFTAAKIKSVGWINPHYHSRTKIVSVCHLLQVELGSIVRSSIA